MNCIFVVQRKLTRKGNYNEEAYLEDDFVL